MRLILAFLFLCNFAHAGILASVQWNAATTTIATTYSTSVEPLSSISYAKVVCAINETGSDVALMVDQHSATVAPSTGQDWYLPAGLGGCVNVDARIPVNVYLRSASGSSITTGLVYVDTRDVVNLSGT